MVKKVNVTDVDQSPAIPQSVISIAEHQLAVRDAFHEGPRWAPMSGRRWLSVRAMPSPTTNVAVTVVESGIVPSMAEVSGRLWQLNSRLLSFCERLRGSAPYVDSSPLPVDKALSSTYEESAEARIGTQLTKQCESLTHAERVMECLEGFV